MVEGVGEADRAAVVVDGERDVLEAERLDEPREIAPLICGPVRPVRGAIAQPEAEMVGRDAAVSRAQLADQVPIQERPGGRTVHHDDRSALALVDIAQTTALDVELARLERVLSAVDPTRNQRSGSFLKAFTISGSGVPIGNTWRTPSCFSASTSRGGRIPPLTTAMSPASWVRSPSMIRRASKRWAPESTERPMTSTSSWIASRTISSGVRLSPE